MRPKSLILLALALGCGLVASIGISQVMDKNNQGPSVSIETTPIYVAMHTINLGDPINASMVSLQDWPKDRVPPGAVVKMEDLEGRRPRTHIIEGEPILEAKLLAPGELADPTGGIPDGFRLKTISVDAETSAAGLLSPGDRVDISLFINRDERIGSTTARTKVILQNIRVFAIEQTIQRSSDGGEARQIPKTVSLLVTPKQANTMTLAERVGEISLIPRNPNDEAEVSVQETTLDELLGNVAPINTREDEQTQGEEKQHDEKQSLLSGIMGMMRKSSQNRPPYKMEIVEADKIREMTFDGITGKPIRGESSSTTPGVAPRIPALPANYQGPGVDAPPGLGGLPSGELPTSLPEPNFPIDLGEPQH